MTTQFTMTFTKEELHILQMLTTTAYCCAVELDQEPIDRIERYRSLSDRFRNSALIARD